MRKLIALLICIISCITTGCASTRKPLLCYEPLPGQPAKAEEAQKVEFAQCRLYPTQRQIASCMYLKGYQLGRCSLDETWHPEGTVQLQ